MTCKGRDFEEAVCRFYRELDPGAVVRFDHRVRDRDVGNWRQVDVWVELKVLGNLPMRILISCKDHRRPLDIGEVETFAGEIRSTGATNGVLYSRGLFTPNALEKARQLNISCCRLFDDQPPELPAEQFLEVYVAVPVHHLLAEVPESHPEHLLWDAVLNTPQYTDGKACRLAEFIATHCLRMLECASCKDSTEPTSLCPQDGTCTCTIAATTEFPSFRLNFALTWRWFRATVDVLRLTGSFNATEPMFIGTATLGPVPWNGQLRASHWAECEPPAAPDERSRFIFTMLAGPTGDHVRHALGRAAFGCGAWTFAPPPGESIFVPTYASSAETLAMQVTVQLNAKPSKC